ncbi:hypothetical protein RJ55_02330 [Drechmeria coniospora]|nr:hypothetical protein RJ55_02330 [Drechmeria coniospora]
MAALDTITLPAPHEELVKHIAQNPDASMVDIVAPYREYEACLRAMFAQDRKNPVLDDPYINVVPLFTDNTKDITTRARDLSQESDEEQARYIMALPDDKRRLHGSPATVADISAFQHNFNVFSESSLVEMDWSNVVAAGSSVVNCLLPVPDEFTGSKRKLREYYHEKFCPASDVDLFLYGLTHDEAIEKMKHIERAIRDALLNEVTVVRTKYAVTIASQYPVRHVQIVLRVYKSVSEILTGFDIDAAGGAYDGKQVYVTPRALGSFITQINHIDLTRRSPSYENRLSKYSHRNFEVYWADLDRSRIDPTIFERSFGRTLGLARLLVLEQLPTTSAREDYLNRRRMERGRPKKHNNYRFAIRSNIKDSHEDEVADWLSEEDVSNYHTFTVPYGEKFNAKHIEKLCYTRDLLLNAEWNQPKERKVYLHRHPAFFGRVDDIVEDCCGSCPTPASPEEIETADKEAEIYISGKLSFLIDNPGRQQIGSFNPLTKEDWTDMAYVGNTASLCQSIVDQDVDAVRNWLMQEDANPNKRDYTGRSPLHLAVMTSSPEIVKCLVDHGCRLTARLADGKTALHLASARGNTEMIRILMERSIENETAEEERLSKRHDTLHRGKLNIRDEAAEPLSDKSEEAEESDCESDGELVDDAGSETEVHSVATGGFVKVKNNDQNDGGVISDESDDEPDYYQVDVLSWDIPCSPLHLAIAEGHEEAVKLLCDYGADSILPVKFLESDSDRTAAILTLTLALSLPPEKAKSMARLLLKLGATSSQADSQGYTAFQKFVDSGKHDKIDVLLSEDKAGIKVAINHLVFTGYGWNPQPYSPIHSAVEKEDSVLTLMLLNAGANAQVDFDAWQKSAKVSPIHLSMANLEQSRRMYHGHTEQPLIFAIRTGNFDAAVALLRNGADPNTLTAETQGRLADQHTHAYPWGESVLDLVRDHVQKLKEYTGETPNRNKPFLKPGMDEWMLKYEPGSYQHWTVSNDVERIKKDFERDDIQYEMERKRLESSAGAAQKKEAIEDALAGLLKLETVLKDNGAKPFAELHPDVTQQDQASRPAFRHLERQNYEFTFRFTLDSSINDARRDGYIQLMEAAWVGNLENIKSMTLEAWGTGKDQAPLKVSIADQSGSSPFSLAFLRGHHDVAWGILEILKAQWSPPEKDKLRYKMKTERDDDDEEYHSEDDESQGSVDEPQIVSEKVDKTFTINDIGKVSMQVESHTKPLNEICKTVQCFVVGNAEVAKEHEKRSLFGHVLAVDDASGLKILLDMVQRYSSDGFSDDDGEDSGERFTFPESDFRWAVEHGKTMLLGQIIKRTGAGIPLDHLVKKSGVEVDKGKPRYYEGLTVYGKKRQDWATAGRGMVTRTSGLRTPPLLHAALGGSLEGVLFFLSDTPHRLYREFGMSKAARDDARLQNLRESPKGFDRAISKWLDADNDLVLHCAVLSDVDEESVELLGYLVKEFPEFLEKKTSEGDTPLMLACRLGRVEYAKLLVSAGANQSVKNAAGENILHAALVGNPTADQVKLLFDIFDSDLRSHLFLQRQSLDEDGTTPLHAWISSICGVSDASDDSYYRYHRHRNNRLPKGYGDQKAVVAMTKLLLGYSEGKELDMLNGAGETCLHTAVKCDMLSLVKLLVDFKPQLLLRENAVGRTPVEISHDRLQSQIFKKPDMIILRHHRRAGVNGLIEKCADDFDTNTAVKIDSPEVFKAKIGGLGLSGDYDANILGLVVAAMGIGEGETESYPPADMLKKLIWDYCSTALAKHAGRRRLVSLNEANDVARRLGESYTTSRYFSVTNRTDDVDDDQKPEDDQTSEDGHDDFVSDFVVSETRMSHAWKFSDYEAEKAGTKSAR